MEIKKFNGVKFRVISVIIFSISVLSCSITKYVPDNSSLLKSVKFKNNNTKSRYGDVVVEVGQFLLESRAALMAAGVVPERICLDPTSYQQLSFL